MLPSLIDSGGRPSGGSLSRAVSFLEPLRGRPVVVIEQAAKALFALDVRVAVGRYRRYSMVAKWRRSTQPQTVRSRNCNAGDVIDVDPIAIAAGPKKRCETADIWMPIGN